MFNFRELKDEHEGKKILNFRSSIFEFLFDIYDIIYKRSYLSLMKVFLNHIKVQFKEENPLIYILASEHTLKRVLRDSSIFLGKS